MGKMHQQSAVWKSILERVGTTMGWRTDEKWEVAYRSTVDKVKDIEEKKPKLNLTLASAACVSTVLTSSQYSADVASTRMAEILKICASEWSVAVASLPKFYKKS